MKNYFLHNLLKKLLKILKVFLITMGVMFSFMIILSFTDHPFWALYWLGTHNSELEAEPNILVLLGGGGMPSADGLNRCYQAAGTAQQYSDAKIIIAIPSDSTRKEESPEKLMAHELIIRGIDSTRFLFENKGTNTYSQVMNIKSMLSEYDTDTIAIQVITSPEHVLRSVAVFRKAGFKHVGGHPAFEVDISEASLLEKKEMERLQEERLNLRYNMWSYLKYEITVTREYFAILYYKLRGWM